MRGLSAGRRLSFPWGPRGKRGLLRPSPPLPGAGGRERPLPSGRRGAERDGCRYKERRQLASGARWRRAEGERWLVPSARQREEGLAEAASLVPPAAVAGRELLGGGSSSRQVRGCLQRAGVPCSGLGLRQFSHPVRGAARVPGRGGGDDTAPGSPEPSSVPLAGARREQRRRRRQGGRLREAEQAPPPASLLLRVPVWRGHRVRAPGRGACGGGGRGRAARCARSCRLETAALLPAARQLPDGAISLHLRRCCLPIFGDCFQKGGLQCFHLPRCQGEGQAEEGDINWSSLKICRAWNDLDYQRVESRNFPSITG